MTPIEPPEDWQELWHYDGTVTLVSLNHDREVTLDDVHMQESVDYWIREDAETGELVQEPGLHYWGGIARVQAASDHLIDLLGGEMLIVLPDGSQGHGYATGDLEAVDGVAVWLITITGVGPTPSQE